MGTIDFDTPSIGKVTGSNQSALSIETHGDKMRGLEIQVDGRNSFGIKSKNLGTGGLGGAIYGEGIVQGVRGNSDDGIGVNGGSARGVGVRGFANGVMRAYGVLGIHETPPGGIQGSCAGICGRGKTAGRFEGDVEVTGDIKLLNPHQADCAEDFDILEENVEPGTVMVLTESGCLQSSRQEYDKKVAGIISGAGGYSPAIILGKEFDDDKNRNKSRLPVALMGKVYCKVDARDSPIETGDLLTTSFTKGHAMRAEDPLKAFGAVIGKALGSLKEGLGMIPVLVTLQ